MHQNCEKGLVFLFLWLTIDIQNDFFFKSQKKKKSNRLTEMIMPIFSLQNEKSTLIYNTKQ